MNIRDFKSVHCTKMFCLTDKKDFIQIKQCDTAVIELICVGIPLKSKVD